MFRKKDIDATQGPIFKNFVIYAIPIAVGSIIQALFNAADMMVLGKMASSIAVASVGATTTIASLLVNTFIGLSGGTQVVLSHAYGSHDRERIKKTVNTSIILAVVLGIVLTVVGISYAEWFLRMTKCPSDCFNGAVIYLKIYFLAIPMILIYNYGSAIIRVSGDTQRPLYYLIACGLLNVILNVILCLVLTEKVAAVAIATLASQVLGAILVMVRLCTIQSDFKFDIKNLCFDFSVLKKILFIGIPAALNSSLYSISNLQIQSAINSFGSAATAGNTAATNVESFIGSFSNAIGLTCLTFVGQNIGANKKDRIKKTIRVSFICAASTGLVLGMGAFLIGRPLLSLFISDDMTAIEYGYIRMKYILTVYSIGSVNNVIGSVLQAFGHAEMPMLNSVFSVLILRFVWMGIIYPNFQTLNNLYFCYTVSWTLSFIIGFTLFSIVYPRGLKKIKEPEKQLA